MKGRLANLIKRSDAENRAARLLRRKGYKIVDKNKSYKFGELDIIAEKALSESLLRSNFAAPRSLVMPVSLLMPQNNVA